ncbi:MAG: DNA ligase (NAD(+)) LigA, partial [bacterium]|nr:DNA ligase (NAD(+)) LigA [bacterium]
VRGEIFIKKSDFETYNKTFDNKYSNPRNLAAGSLRNIKSSIVAKIPLNIFAYEGFFEKTGTNDHILTLSTLKQQGFHINNNMGFFSTNKEKQAIVREALPQITIGDVDQLAAYVKEQMSRRDQLDHEIDGLVIKVNELDVRETLGYTSHHPRWALAFKFDAPKAHTRLLDVHIQVGRNGRVTAVGILKPVKIAGSTVSRATLHNQEYIEMLELGIGDEVSISKRGDIIPAVEEVLEKNPDNPTVFKYPHSCPFCDTTLEKDGAHHFCKNLVCPERQRRAIMYFVAKKQMDIDTLGEKTIAFLFDKGFVKDIPDHYTFDYDKLLGQEGFKEKKIGNIKKSIEISKTRPFRKVLTALGYDGLGTVAVKDLIMNGFNTIDKIIEVASRENVEDFSVIEGFGEIMGRLVIKHFTNPKNLELIKQLKTVGLNFEEDLPEPGETDGQPLPFDGQTWVITGTFENFTPRSKAAEEIEKRGGKVGSSVSAKTTYLLAGAAAGSKLAKAKKLNVTIVEEAEFLGMLK